MRTNLGLIAALLLLLGMSACAGGGNGGRDSLQPVAGITGADDRGQLPGLEGLDELAAGSRSASILGPGWYELWHEDIRDSAFMSLGSGNAIVLNAGSGSAFALYCLRGFDSDFSPTSVRTSPQAGSDTPYMLLFADYSSGRWTSTGPHSGAVELDLPGTADGSRHPLDYVSPAGRVYVAVLTTEAGVDLKLDNIELGIHGGLLAPRPPGEVTASAFADGSVANWEHSPDYNRPDFAGYAVERLNLLSGEWDRLATTGPLETSVLIPGVRQTISYRVAALDVSGNQSGWSYTADSGGLVIGAKVMQVAVEMPRGPLYGPVEVSFDMSGSSSPNDPIMEYRIGFETPGLDYTGPDPVVTRTLQPGCYFITFEVNDGGGLSADYGETTRTLVVYPRWQEEAVTVREPQVSASFDRFNMLNGGINPQSGELLLVSDDYTMSGTAIRRGRPGDLRLDSVPYADNAPHVYSDPVFIGDTAYIGVQSLSGSSYVIVSSPSGSHLIEGSFTFRNIVPVSTGAELYLMISTPTAIGAINLTGTSALLPIVSGLSSSQYMDACWNPVTETIDIMLDDSGSLSYLSWDPQSMIITDDDSALLDPLEGGLDVEADPATGDLCVISRSGGKNVFLRKPVDGAFSAAVEIDNPIINFWPADLAWHAGSPYAVFAGGTGETRTYLLQSGAASLFNTADYSADAFYSGCLLDDPESGKLMLCDRDATASLFISLLNDDDTEDVQRTLVSDLGWGRWLDSAIGSDGFHLLMGNASLSVASHMFSPDGSSWIETDSATTDGYADLFDNQAGEVFRSNRDATGYDVSVWNGSAWDNRFIVPGSQTREAISAGNRPGSTTAWVLEDTDASNLVRSQGNAAGFSTSAISFPDTTHVFKGRLAYDAVSGIQPAFVLYAKPALFQSFGLLNPYDGTVRRLFGFSDSIGVISDLAAFDDKETAGRVMEMMPYRLGTSRQNSDGLACWSVNGRAGSAFRCCFRNDSGTPRDEETVDLPFRNSDWRREEIRRTVSAAQANGRTAVAVMSSLDGKHSLLEWSCFGEWEELPLPPLAGRPCQAELLVDGDGRWHMFWRDPDSGRVYCQSTLP